MTVSTLSTSSLARDTFANARAVILPTAPGLFLFAAAVAGQSWFNQLAAGGGQLTLLWMAVGLVTIFVGCFWSADMYRKLLPEAGNRSLFVDAARLFLANLAVYGLYFILLFLLTLFFLILVGILIGTTGYDPSAAPATQETIRESLRALSDSGGAVLLYILLFVAVSGLVWLGLRLFVFGVATVSEARLTIFRSWPWTARNVSRIALLWVMLQLLPWICLTLLASGMLRLNGVETVFSFSAAGEVPARTGGPAPWAVAALTGAATLIMAPFYWIGHGLAVALYQRLAPNRVDAETTFG